MNKADYIRRVNALDLPDGLYAKLSALPDGGTGKPAEGGGLYRAFLGLAAALVLVVGLGIATPAILHAMAPEGGEVKPTPVITATPPATPMPTATAAPAPADPWGIRLSAEKVTATGLTLVCEQSGGEPTGELQTGQPYTLERYEDGQWQSVDSLGRLAWTMEGWRIPKEDSVRWSVGWSGLYGALTDGRYRIGKKIMDLRAPGDYDERDYFAEFTVGPEAQPPELREDGDGLLIRYPGETEWVDILPMLPLPKEWTTSSHAPAIDGVTSMAGFYSGLYYGFTSPTEGWLVLGGGAAMGTAYNYVYLTHDGGHTWLEATGDLNSQCTMMLNCAAFSDEKHGFLGFRYEWYDAPLYWTEDGGKSWKLYDLDSLLPTNPDDAVSELTDIRFAGSEGTLTFTLHYRNERGEQVRNKIIVVHDFSAGQESTVVSPELREEGGGLLIRYPGETGWADVLPMLPLPKEWSSDNHAASIDGVTSMEQLSYRRLYYGFSAPKEGWLVLGSGAEPGLAFNYIYLTHDGGHTWADVTGDLNTKCNMVLNCAAFSDEKHGFLGYHYAGIGNAPILWTENGGESWSFYDVDILPLPKDPNTLYELTDVSFAGSDGTLYLTRHNRDDQGRPLDTKLRLGLTDYGTGYSMDGKPIFDEPLDPYSIKSSQLPYGESYEAWMGPYEALPLRPLARLKEAGIDLYGLNEYWCGTSGVLLVRDRDMSTAAWYDLPCYRTSGSCTMALADYDGDGTEELALSLTIGSGTGTAESHLYMVEPEGRSFGACTAFDEAVYRPLVLDALRTLGVGQYDQFGQWQIYSFAGRTIRMELGVQSKDNPPPFMWQGFLYADVGWDGEAKMFSLKNARFTKNE